MGICSGTFTEWLFIHCSRFNWNLEAMLFVEGGDAGSGNLRENFKTVVKNSKFTVNITPQVFSNFF